MTLERFNLNGVNIAGLKLQELPAVMYQKLNSSTSPSMILTLNLDHLREVSINREFEVVCRESELVVPDSIGVTTLLRLKHKRRFELVTGNDVLRTVLEDLPQSNIRVAFVGSTKQSLEALKKRVSRSSPNIHMVAAISPPFEFEKNPDKNREVLDELAAVRPDVLFVALGSPRQELWIAKHKDIIKAKIGVGIGAALDFYSGVRTRSPRILRLLGLEWLWRLFHEPARLFKRYVLLDFPFFVKQVFHILYMEKQP